MSAESPEPSGLSTAHIDCDAFYVSIELQRRPELRGLPVVVAGTGPRAVVTTASYEARRYGVGSAIPAARARRLCPQAVFLPPDFPTYREVSGQVMGIVRAQVERVEVVGLDEAYLDVSGLYSPRAAMRRLVHEIREATGIVCSVGIGPNKLVAKVASDAEKPAGFVVLTREQACARFGGSPPGLVPGIGPKTAARLARAGPHHARRPRRRPGGGCWSSASAPTSAASCAAARASNTMARSAPRARSSRSRASAPSTTTSTTPRS